MIEYNGFNSGLDTCRPPAAAVAAGAPVNMDTDSHSGSNRYLQNQIVNASPEKILLMLFDGAIRFTREAIAANNEGNTARKLEKIGRVFNIIAELSNTLDHNIGGGIAEELDALYQFNLRELGLARRDTTNRHLEFVENFLVDWRTTWRDVIEINRTAAAGGRSEQETAKGLAVAG